MNRRKIENWVLFCLKMLPFLFLIIFAVFLVDNHDYITPDLENQIVIGLDYFSPGDSYDSQDIVSIDEDNNYYFSINDIGYLYAYGDGLDLHLIHTIPIDSLYNLFTAEGEFSFSYNISFSENNSNNYLSYSLDFFAYSDFSYDIEFDITNSFYQVGDVSFFVDEIYSSDFNNIIYGDFSYINVELILNSYLPLSYDFISLTSFTCNDFIYVNIIYEFIYGYQSFTNLDPLSKFLNSFNYFVDDHFNFNLFNTNDFLNWIDNYWFNGNIPIICKSIFYILIYELLIDLLYLIYSFICFIVKFAQKWLNGIYNKDW